MPRSFADLAESPTTFDPESKFENVIDMHLARKSLQEAQERRERIRARAASWDGFGAPVAAPDVPNGLPKWPGGVDDLEIGE